MNTILRAIIGYFFLLLTVRALSRRPGAQMTPFEFVLIFLIGGVVMLATVGDDRSEVNSVCAVMTVGLLHRLIARLKQRFPRFGLLVDGTPLVLIKDGQWQKEVMDKMRIQDTDVMAAARSKGAKTLQDIGYAILERNGGISIIEAEK
jgi:uncharacterized membrane protein YcaP (DUF421 family)